MNGGGGDLPPPSNGGEFLLSLIQQRPHNPHHPHPPQQQSPPIDPAVAAIGPTIPVAMPPWQIAGTDHHHPHPHHLPPQPWTHHTLSSSPLYPPNYFGLPHNPFPLPRTHFPVATPNSVANGINANVNLTHDLRKLGFPIEESHHPNNNNNTKVDGFVQQLPQHELKLQFGSLPTVAYSASQVSTNGDSLLNLKFNRGGYNGLDRNLYLDHPTSNSSGNVVLQGSHGVVENERRELGNYRGGGSLPSETGRAPPGFGNKNRGKGLEGRNENLYGRREGGRTVAGERSNVRGNVGLVDQLDRPGPPAGSHLHSGLANETGIGEFGGRDSKHKAGVERLRMEGVPESGGTGADADVDALGEQLADSLLVDDESDDRTNLRQRPREKVNIYIS